MKAILRQMGNSRGVIIPKTLIAHFGFENEVEIKVTREGIVLAKPKASVRDGWDEASRKLAKQDDDALAWPEFTNKEDGELTW